MSVPVRVGGRLWVSLLGFLKSEPSEPELPDGEYSQTFHPGRTSFVSLGAMKEDEP